MIEKSKKFISSRLHYNINDVIFLSMDKINILQDIIYTMYENVVTLQNDSPGAPLRIVRAGESFCDGSYYIERDGWSQAVLEYVISGKGTLNVNGETVHPQTGDVYIVPPMNHHRYASDAFHPWHKIWLNIDGPFVPQLLAAYGLQNVLLIKQFFNKTLFENAIERLKAEPKISAARALEIVGYIVAEIGTYYVRKNPSFKELTPEILKISEQSSFSLKELCKNNDISETHMIRIFRKKYGKSPYAFWLENKLKLAENLLANTELPVKNVALETGFKDPAYFSRLFRRKHGFTPLEYRTYHQKIQRGKRSGYR